MIKTTTFYSSSNGDRWQLIQDDEINLQLVRHEPNLASGGKTTDVPVPDLLSRSGTSPQALALRRLLDRKGASDPDLED